MELITQTYEMMIERFVAWAEKEAAVTAAVVIGSRARKDHPADEWADLDLIIVTKDPARMLDHTDWLEGIGKPVLTFVENSSGGEDKERRVLFDNGLDVDFSVTAYDRLEMALNPEVFKQIGGEMKNVFGRGARVLLDKEGQLKRLGELMAGFQSPAWQPPPQSDYMRAVHDFWYHAVWSARHLRRGEIWWAKGGCDGHLKSLLFVMLECHAHATQGAAHDTWFRGRFLEEWADPRAVRELRAVFAHYDAEDIWQALFATMDLFRWLALETAQHLGFTYPAEGDAFATRLTRELYEGRP